MRATLTIKRLVEGKYHDVTGSFPPVERITANDMKTMVDKPIVLKFQENERELYALGQDSLKGKWSQHKITMSMSDFAEYWQYKQMEYAMDIFSMKENREERLAICEADNVPKEAIQKIFEERPMLYGVQQELL